MQSNSNFFDSHRESHIVEEADIEQDVDENEMADSMRQLIPKDKLLLSHADTNRGSQNPHGETSELLSFE